MTVDVLIIDDEEDIRNLIASVLQDEGYSTREGCNSTEALDLISKKRPDVVILDVWLNDSELDGIQILERIKDIHINLPVIIISGHGTVDMAVAATKKGAYDFLSKPFKIESLINTIVRSLEDARLKAENIDLKTRLGTGEVELVGDCKEIRSVRKKIAQFSKDLLPVLISGKSGTGKGIAARLIHRQSKRAGALITFDCSRVNDNNEGAIFGTTNPQKSGSLDDANSGSIIIDNIEKLDLSLQQKVASYLIAGTIKSVGSNVPRTVTARVILTTKNKSKIHKDLLALLSSEIDMPTLQDRVSDMSILCKTLMMYRSKSRGYIEKKFSESSIVALSNQKWNANLWDLMAVIDSLLVKVNGSLIDSNDINNVINKSDFDKSNESIDSILMLPIRESREDFERYYLSYHLGRFNRNVTSTAKFVGMDRASLSRKMKLLGLN